MLPNPEATSENELTIPDDYIIVICMKLKTVSVSEFKAKALRLLEEVGAGQLELLVTKRGKPLAKVARVTADAKSRGPNRLAHTIVEEGDIVSPLGPGHWGILK